MGKSFAESLWCSEALPDWFSDHDKLLFDSLWHKSQSGLEAWQHHHKKFISTSCGGSSRKSSAVANQLSQPSKASQQTNGALVLPLASWVQGWRKWRHRSGSGCFAILNPVLRTRRIPYSLFESPLWCTGTQEYQVCRHWYSMAWATHEKNEKELLICGIRINPYGKKSSLMDESNNRISGVGFFPASISSSWAGYLGILPCWC